MSSIVGPIDRHRLLQLAGQLLEETVAALYEGSTLVSALDASCLEIERLLMLSEYLQISLVAPSFALRCSWTRGTRAPPRSRRAPGDAMLMNACDTDCPHCQQGTVILVGRPGRVVRRDSVNVVVAAHLATATSPIRSSPYVCAEPANLRACTRWFCVRPFSLAEPTGWSSANPTTGP
jgi:hypothetical protein